MSDFFTNIWLIIGVVCIAAELLVPGLVLVFVGLGALTTYACIFFGLIDSTIYQVICFLISSIIYLLGLRTILVSFFPTETIKSNINEDEIERGTIVLVDQDIEVNSLGRIRYQDTTWAAKSKSKVTIAKGENARIIGRENITYIVEPIKD